MIEQLMTAVNQRRLTPDTVMAIAYLLSPRSDSLATIKGRQIAQGELSESDANFLAEHVSELPLALWDEIEG